MNIYGPEVVAVELSRSDFNLLVNSVAEATVVYGPKMLPEMTNLVNSINKNNPAWTQCDTDTWRRRAEALNEARIIVLNDYRKQIYVLQKYLSRLLGDAR